MNIDNDSNGLRERLARLPKVALDDAPPLPKVDLYDALGSELGIGADEAVPVGGPRNLEPNLYEAEQAAEPIADTMSFSTAEAEVPVAPKVLPGTANIAPPSVAIASSAQYRTARRKQQQKQRNITVTAAYVIFMLICLAISLDLFAPLDPKRELVAAPDEQGDLYSGSQRILDSSFNGQVTISYLNGDSYVGELHGNRFSGYGLFTAANGWSIEGDFIDGRMNGKGVYRDQKGVYEGSFDNSLPHGQGSYRASSGWRYDGQLQAGRISGYGLFTAADGSEYEGNFLNGYAHGRGKVQSSAWSYDGDFTAGYRNGQGTLTFADGQTVTAQWDAGQPAG